MNSALFPCKVSAHTALHGPQAREPTWPYALIGRTWPLSKNGLFWPQDGMANMANPSFLDGPNARQLKCTDLNTLSLREMKICTHVSSTFALPMYKQVSQLLSIPTNVGQKFWADFPSPFPPKPAPKLTIDRPSHSREFQSLLFDPSSL